MFQKIAEFALPYLAFGLALIPVYIWSYIFFDDTRKQYRWLYIIVFSLGTLTVLPILAMQAGYREYIMAMAEGQSFLTQKLQLLFNNDFFNGNYNFVKELQNKLNPLHWIIIYYTFVAVTEEIVKFYIVRISDKKHPELITNINQSLKFGILSGLGFAFSENILYFIFAYETGGQAALLSTFIFRSSFTVCAHICFTAIFSYYYGMSKFSQDFVDFKKWTGQKVAYNEYKKIRNKYIFMGLSASIILHALFNITLELNDKIAPLKFLNKDINISVALSILLVVGMFIFLQYLLSRKTGNLTFVLADKHRSSMAKKDEEVVLELIGMWYNQKKYTQVEQICDRLLKRDPDNNVVKIFKAKIQEKK